MTLARPTAMSTASDAMRQPIYRDAILSPSQLPKHDEAILVCTQRTKPSMEGEAVVDTPPCRTRVRPSSGGDSGGCSASTAAPKRKDRPSPPQALRDDGSSSSTTTTTTCPSSPSADGPRRKHARRSGSVDLQSSDEIPPPPPSPGVRFSDPLVSEIWTRPYTAPEDIHVLFYSVEDEDRFREEYDEESERDDAESLDESTKGEFQPQSPKSTAITSDLPSELLELLEPPSSPMSRKKEWGISKAVVVHDGNVRTYYHDNEGSCDIDADSSEASLDTSDFLDDPSFWNGDLTWFSTALVVGA